MVEMDAQRVLLGDTVYDVVYGPGRVQQVPNQATTQPQFAKFIVVFQAGSGPKTITYNGLGLTSRFSTRTLYWKNPAIIVPTKNDSKWLMIQRIVAVIVDEIRRSDGVEVTPLPLIGSPNQTTEGDQP